MALVVAHQCQRCGHITRGAEPPRLCTSIVEAAMSDGDFRVCGGSTFQPATLR